MTRFGIVVASGGLVVIIGFGWGFRDTLSSWFAGESPQVEESHTHEAGDIAYWTCPMHPSVKAEEAGPCPICGMDLAPVPVARKVEESSPAEASSERPQGMPGFITLTAWQQQLIGVTAETVERRSLDATLRTVGRVDYDETRLTDVNLKVTGWIRKLYVDFTGRPVKQGEPLFTLYSPELLSTQEEYLLAHAAVNRLENAAGEVGDAEAQSEVRKEAIVRSQTVLESARQRLLLWDLNEKQIQQLVKDGKPKTTVTVYAPAAGFVVQKMAVEGMFVQPGMRLYRIGSLDAVWVIADVYEYEIAAVHVGQEAIISLSYQPNKTFEGLVDYIYPDLNPKTRTAKIRLKVPNP
ncbi:MAG: efflux RND transporter periplasmic adaptor subunit, partial [Planctomycetota bacterium]|nr:efflux RND transporter periplasmic adaptor subunit [Planctomycetota bacterium]